MQNIIPDSMLAVGLNEQGDRLTARSVPVPVPAKGQVLVKISAAPVNPSDITRIKNLTASEKMQFIGGIEGSGKVVAHGGGILPSLWMGRRVACSSVGIRSGTWAQYMLTSAATCVPLPPSISDEQGSMLLVNPMTAVSFMKLALRGGHKAIINTAASSALGRMIEFLAKRNGIPLIQVVRNKIQKDTIEAGGGEFVLDSSAENFELNLHALAKKLRATLALDAVGGEMTKRLLLSIPFGSTVLIYGNLSGQHPQTDHRSLVIDNKKVQGFYLVNWLRSIGMATKLQSILEARGLLDKHISIPVRTKLGLNDAQVAVDTYLDSMSAGKVLLIP